MAFPQVAAVNGGYNDTSSTSHTVNLPSGIAAGDLLLVFFTAGPVSSVTVTFPAGWTELYNASTSYLRHVCYYRIADGTEGTTITVTTSLNGKSAHTSYRITGAGTPECGTAVTGFSSAPNPPSLTPSWGALDTLWFAACGYNTNETVTAYPTNYTDGRNDVGTSITSRGVGTARRELNAASEDPDNFTLSVAEYWVANTVAIQSVIAKTSSDSGSGTDARVTGSPVATLVRADSGAGVEAILDRDLVIAETGAGVDTKAAGNPLATLTQADSGAGVDALLSLIAALVKSDSGIGIEKVLDRDIVIAETGAGVDAISLFDGKQVADSGSGVDASILTSILSKVDSGTGLDTSALLAILTATDSGMGVDKLLLRLYEAIREDAAVRNLGVVRQKTPVRLLPPH